MSAPAPAAELSHRHLTRLKQRSRVLLLLDAVEQVGIAPLPSPRLHAFAYLADVLSPVWDLVPFDGKVYKSDGGPHYPDLQDELDCLVVMGLVQVTDLRYLPTGDGGARVTGSYGLDFASAHLEMILGALGARTPEAAIDPADRNLHAFLVELAGALATLPDEQIESAAGIDATYQATPETHNVNDLARHDPIRDREPSATLPELMDALAHFHQTQLFAPTCCPDGVWEPGCADRYVPGPQPERSIQSTLMVALAFWFRGVVRAEPEDKTSIGRIDIRLLRKNEDGSLGYWVIMELKVIKSFRNAPRGSVPSPVPEAENVAAIVEGVRQAGAYRENRSTEEGRLEIYDLREEKANDLTKQGKVLDALNRFTPHPEIHVWPVFGSAHDARIAGFTGA